MTAVRASLLGLVWVLGALLPSASSSRDPALLLSVQGQGRPYALYLAVQIGSEEALGLLSDYASQSQDPYWLLQAARAGDADAHYALALKEDNESRYLSLLGRAADGGHAQAQYELALLTDDIGTRLRWLQKAAEQGYLPAEIALYQWYFAQQQLDAALPWLEKAAQHDGASALLLARRLWKQGQYPQAQRLFEHAKTLGAPQAADYLQLIRAHWRNQAVNLVSGGAVKHPDTACRVNLQPLALSLENLLQYQQLAAKFRDDKRLRTLPVCFADPLWLKPNTLTCSDNWQGSRRLGCDAAQLDKLPLDPDFTHVLILAELGKANVHNGIMYLDLGDTYSVFVHELAHFAGFVDEYPLSTEMAEQVCQPHHPAPNLVIVQDTDAWQAAQQKWGQDSQDWTLTPARTCNNHPLQAFKASDKLTFMEYHDQEYIPELYLAQWKARFSQPDALLPAYINIAQALEAQGQQAAAQRWWQRQAPSAYHIYGPYPPVAEDIRPASATDLIAQ